MAMNDSDLEYYRHLLSPAEMAQLVQAIRRPLMPAIRVNTLKIDVAEALDIWTERYGWQTQRVPFCAEGWRIIGGSQGVGQTLEHKIGLYYIQKAASMLPVEMFNLDNSETSPLILDMAASPGGKTTHIVSKMDDKGLVIANDISWNRIVPLRSNLQDWGTMCTIVSNYPGEHFGSWFPDVFDRVLLDAPCSGESLRSCGQHRKRPVSARERDALHRRQVNLLTSAFRAVKPGGEIVYATCTLAPEEDEAVLDELLNLYPQQTTIETVSHILPTPAPGLTSDGERGFHPEICRAVRLWPHLYNTSDFFAALIRKQDFVPIQFRPPPVRSLAEVGFEMVAQEEKSQISSHLLQIYGFDLDKVIERHSLTLWKREQSVYAIPEQFLSRFADFPCVSRGMLIGERLSEDFVPSHELVARFSCYFKDHRLMLSEEQAKIWLAGRDLRGWNDVPYPSRTVIILEDEKRRFLGRGRVLSRRIRNMLPKRWV
jgi:16S rRNA (cytosine1407-C5)-methyltransferase